MHDSRPTVRVHRCPPFDHVQFANSSTSAATQAALRYSHVTVDALIGQALLRRYGGHAPSARVDLEYVPLICFGRAKNILGAPEGESAGMSCAGRGEPRSRGRRDESLATRRSDASAAPRWALNLANMLGLM